MKMKLCFCNCWPEYANMKLNIVVMLSRRYWPLFLLLLLHDVCGGSSENRIGQFTVPIQPLLSDWTWMSVSSV